MKKIKRILASLMVVAMLLTTAPLSGFVGLELPNIFDIFANAEAYSGTCGDNLTWTLDMETGKLVISGTGDMYNYDCVLDEPMPMHSSSPWGIYLEAVVSVTISKGVTSIGEYAFLYDSTFSGLTNITIPDSVTSIGDGAFEGCSKLTSITIPDSVTSIGARAFSYCYSLTNVTIPESVTSISDGTFECCDSLTRVIIPDSVTSIGADAFWGCNNLTNVTIPDSVKCVGDYAFYRCSNITSIAIPDSVISIGDLAFSYCESLTSVTIPDSVTSIGDSVFYECYSLASINVDDGNIAYSSDEYGALFNKEKTELIQYPIGNKRVEYIIPDSVTSIGDSAFESCSNLTRITIPESVTSLGSGSFSWCDKLVDIKISTNLTHIGSFAFSATGYSQNLSNWENGLLYVGEFLVSCQERENILVKDGTKLIADEVFLYHESMISITLPESLRYIGSYAFYCCNSLSDVYYSGTHEQWNSISVDTNNECLTNANIHYAFEPVTSVYAITFNANGGLNAPAAQMKTYGVDLILSKTTPTKSGYVFLGWSTNKNATVAQYQAGDVFSTDADITLYAVWVAKNIYNLGEETYSFSNFGDSDSQGGHCFGMSMTSSGYYLGELDVTDIGIDISSKLYTVSKTTSVKKPICYYQGIQGYYATNATVAGGTYYKYGYYDINSDWNDVINYVKSHKYDDTGAFQIGYRKNGQGGHAINFLRYENVDGQDRIYVYDNNFPDTETYFCKGTDGKIYQKPYSTFSGAIDCIALRNVYDYFELAKDFDVSRVIYAKADTIEIEGVTAYPMELDGSEEYMMYEIPEDVDSIIIVPLDDYVTFEYMEETYEFGTVSDETYGVFTLSTTEETKDESFIIENAGKDTSNMCGDNLYWSFDEETGHLVISGTGDMYNYGYGKSPWYNSDLSIKKVTINNGVTSIGDYAFLDCDDLVSVTIPDSVRTIGDCAFEYCRNLADVSIPESVTSIGAYAFDACNLENIVISANVAEIGYCAFSWCNNLVSITVDKKNPSYSSDEFGVLYNKDMTELIQYPVGNMRTSYIIPDSVIKIHDDSFATCRSLSDITIGNNVKYIGGEAFRECTGIKSIVIPDSVIYMENAFIQCDNLVNVVIGSGVTHIQTWTFAYCRKLTDVTLSNSIKTISEATFDECPCLADVYYNGTEDEWNSTSIGTRNDSLLNATIHFKSSPSVVPGDPTGDNKINSTDALLCLQHSVGKIKLEGDTFTAADVDKNGFVNSSDALKILQFSVGKIDKL